MSTSDSTPIVSGADLRLYRLAHRLSQRQLAERMGIWQHSVVRIEARAVVKPKAVRAYVAAVLAAGER